MELHAENNGRSHSGALWEVKNAFKLFSAKNLNSLPMTNSYGLSADQVFEWYQLLGMDHLGSSRRQGDSCNSYGMK